MVATKSRKVREEKGARITSEQIFQAGVSRTIAEEVELEKTSDEIKKIKEQTVTLIKAMEAAREAENEELRREKRNEVVVLNLRLVTQVLKKYGYFSPDKFQNGCVGLLKAADTYKSETAVPFANYACFCIENEIRLAFGYANRQKSMKQDYLRSLDAAVGNGDGGDKETDGHASVADEFSYQQFDGLIAEAEVDMLFYEIIIPAIDECSHRITGIDLEAWRLLELQYIMGLSIEQETKRITLPAMAVALNSTPQSLRVRHNKVMDVIRRRCILYGYSLHKGVHGCYVVYNDPTENIKKR